MSIGTPQTWKTLAQSWRLSVVAGLCVIESETLCLRIAHLLAGCAVAAGTTGVFAGTHPEPDKALSEGPEMIPLREIPALLAMLVNIHRTMPPSTSK